MPLYEYRCTQCGHQFEKIQSFSAPDEKECPACKGELERLISAPAVQFKGSGFYSTDYGSGSSKGPSKSGESKSSESGGSSDKSASNSADGGSSSSSASASGSSSAPASSTSSSSKSE